MPIVEKAISPNENALNQIAHQIWDFARQTGQAPLVLTTTNGPINQLRQELQKARPMDLPPKLAFLPKVLGLPQWLSQTPSLIHFPPVRTPLERWEMVYSQLAKYKKIQEKFGALGDGGKWALVKAIVQACDFLTRAHISFVFQGGENLEQVYQIAKRDFDQALQAAYPNLDQGLLQDEGALIMAFWRNLTSTEDPLVREALAYQLRQQELEKTPYATPIVWIEMATPVPSVSKIQDQYIQVHAQQQPVLKITMDWTSSALWPECIDGQFADWDDAVLQQIEKNRHAKDDHHWRFIKQPSFEKMAWGALSCIREHIQAGRHRIALIAQDRLVARRVRALLDRLGPNLTVIDRTGWKLSTTNAAAALQSYLELINSGPGPNLSTLLGFLKNPLLNWETITRQLLVDEALDPDAFAWFVESSLLSRVSGEDWVEWVRVFEPDQRDEKNDHQQLQYLSATKAFIKILRDLAMQWQSQYQTSQDWTDLLKNHLIQLGMMDALQVDPAGKNVLDELHKLGQLQQSKMSVSGWVSLFDTWLEQSSFTQELEYQSVRISIIPLSSTRLNRFDAVVMVGCDNRQLPSPVDHGSIFSRAMLKALDEQLPVYEYLSQARDLSQLLVTHIYVDFLWQEFQKAEEVNRPAAWLTRLQMGLPSFKDVSIDLSIGQTQSVGMLPSKTKVLYPGLLPTQISPSSYQSLRTCPYRFFVTYILKLRSPKALQDMSEFGSIGTLLHDILKEFYRSYDKHQAFPSQPAQRKWMEQELTTISREQWNKLIQLNGQLLYEQEQWLEQVPAWVDWQLNQESNGWRFDEAEKNLEFALQLSNGVSILVKGRADRIDRKAHHELRVWDYKFKSLEKLKKSQKHLEDDPQLLMYSNALLVKGDSEISIRDTGWIGLRDPKGMDRTVMQELSPEILEDLQGQMTSVLSQVWQGKSLPANGPTQICQYCEARGLCRKGMF